MDTIQKPTTYDVGGVRYPRPFKIRRLGQFGFNVAAQRQVGGEALLDGGADGLDAGLGPLDRLGHPRVGDRLALLEAKPVCVFDEWAADQDPEFRRHFYEAPPEFVHYARGRCRGPASFLELLRAAPLRPDSRIVFAAAAAPTRAATLNSKQSHCSAGQ